MTKNFNINILGDPYTQFVSENGLLLAIGYQRIVIGKRGPYIEFFHNNIMHGNFTVPMKEMWRIKSSIAYYVEYRSCDEAYVKLYHQKKIVKYADYLIDKFYISPYNLYVNGKCCMKTKEELISLEEMF